MVTNDFFEQLLKTLPFLDALNHYFGEVLYCVPEGFRVPPLYRNRTLDYGRLYFIRKGELSEASACFPNICIEKAYEYSVKRKQQWKGFLLKGDDTFVFHRKPLFHNNFDRILIQKSFNVYDTKTRCHSEKIKNGTPTNCGRSAWDTWEQEKQIAGAKLVLKDLKTSDDLMLNQCADTLDKKLGTNTRLYYQMRVTDFVFIPSKMVKQYIILMRPFIEYNLIFEMALPNVIECITGDSNHSIFSVMAINKDGKIRQEMIKDPHGVFVQTLKDNTAFLHPIKLSGMIENGLVFRDFFWEQKAENKAMFNQKLSANQITFCNDLLPYVFKYMLNIISVVECFHSGRGETVH